MGAWIGTADRKPSYIPASSPEDAFAEPEQASVETAAVPAPEELPLTYPRLDDQFPLRLGSVGPRVERLKVWLMRNYGAQGVVTEAFDPATLDRVQRYLKVDQVSEALYQKHRMGQHVQFQSTVR